MSVAPSSPSGHYVQGHHAGRQYWAFIPHALPPDVPLTAELLRAHSDADRALATLSGISHKLRNPHVLMQPFIYREAVLSSRIEGTRTSAAELVTYRAARLSDTAPTEQTSDAHEVLNYVDALEYGIQRLDNYPLSMWFIRELHRVLLSGVRGGYATPGEIRLTQNFIGAPASTIERARYIPPPPFELHGLLDALTTYVGMDDIYPGLLRIALIHYQFEAIHPFIDGNGRVGRLLISVLLHRWNLLLQPVLYLSAFFERHRRDYYDLLLGVTERGEWHEWVVFFLCGVATEAWDAVERITQLERLANQWRAELAEQSAAPSLVRLAEHVFEYPIITMPEVAQLLGVTYRTARLNVLKLVELGYLQPANDATYRRSFIAHDIMRVIEGGHEPRTYQY